MTLTGCRGSSIKTRIETRTCYHSQTLTKTVAEVVPLKQGLKPGIITALTFTAFGCRGSSIKTRIETNTGGVINYARLLLQR